MAPGLSRCLPAGASGSRPESSWAQAALAQTFLPPPVSGSLQGRGGREKPAPGGLSSPRRGAGRRLPARSPGAGLSAALIKPWPVGARRPLLRIERHHDHVALMSGGSGPKVSPASQRADSLFPSPAASSEHRPFRRGTTPVSLRPRLCPLKFGAEPSSVSTVSWRRQCGIWGLTHIGGPC